MDMTSLLRFYVAAISTAFFSGLGQTF